VNKGSDGKVKSVEAEQNIENKDYKKTMKLTWLCNDKDNSPTTPTILIYYDHIISKAILDKDDDFKSFVGTKTKHEVEMLGDPELKDLKKGDCVQIQRRGYFICDVPYAPYSQSVGRARPCVLLAIPDGTPTSYGLPGASAKPAPIPAKGGKEDKKGGQKKAAKPAPAASAGTGGDLGAAVSAQGDLVRKLKADKAAKPEIDEAVKNLLALKADFKAATGSDWKPGGSPATPAKASPPPAAAGGDLGAAVAAQGDLVRKLKADKAAKPEIDEAVKKLLALKADFKAATGSDWKPGATAAPSASSGGNDIGAAVAAQGDLVRKLKAEKASKPEIDEAVKKLLALKADFKADTGSDWKPGATTAPAKACSPPAASGGGDIGAAVAAQGDLVRKLKADKAAKPEIDEAVKKLLALKADYKAATGNDWKPGAAPTAAAKSGGGAPQDNELGAKVAAQGDLVRQLKADKKPKEEIDTAVKALLALKVEYKNATGADWQPAGGGGQQPKKQDKKKEKKEAPKVED